MSSSPTIFFEFPSADLFRFPPSDKAGFVPPPAPGSVAHAPPFQIPDHIYKAVLDPRVPITIATLYAVSAKLLNRYNRSTGKRPWAISRTRTFFAFVVLHNVFLSVYSAWTFIGMFGALRRGIVNPFSVGGWTGTVDSFCRMNGPPGLGNAIYYDETADHWSSYASPVGSNIVVSPEREQLGRVWNEGLAFYGWIFYLSKFYEVLDTFIILAKGKYSSTLQTYHHAGAMMCMWAGMRYMSAPIWMFAFVNSGIHALMYTYYTITAFSIRVPTAIKRSLTSLQITQFLIGASYAMSHSFVSYSVPLVQSPAADAATASPSTAATNSTSSALAVGDVLDSSATRVVPCATTSGETFAIWLNVVYLAPLTYLFVSFFIASYLRRSNAENARTSRLSKADTVSEPQITVPVIAHPSLANTLATTANAAVAAEENLRRRLSNVGTLAEKAGWDAARDLEKEVYGESNGSAIDDEAAVDADPYTDGHLSVRPRTRSAKRAD